ncbi:MAG: type II toxin-antitoxin system RelE/ParE family toxin [Candidatus Rokubacteria bacterium]|nr:type II toxin-antitoxin system RelE/ParE family toxin [Candidatus Rokubacteria bacterium]
MAFAKSVQRHFSVLTARERALILDAIERQLIHQPLKETRNRKALRPNPIAPWQLRVEHLRIFYEVAGGDSEVVRILAVGRKRRNSVIIGTKEIRL